MANIGFCIVGALGLGALALGVFPSYFGERFIDTATFTRIAGAALIGAAFFIRSTLRQ